MKRTVAERRSMIDKGHAKLNLVQQCMLLSISRSGLYYKPCGESKLNLELMRLMDEHYLEYPHKGAGRMHTWLTKDVGYKVSQNRIERLYYKKMGLRSLLPGPHTSKRRKEDPVYPYLLRGLAINRPNQVWATDITYIPMRNGFMYLMAIIDLHSRYVVNWSVSNSMEAQWCTDVFKEAVAKHGPPGILNTDQGSQFTSEAFTTAVLESSKLSMDGKGRATDNAFIERLWRTVKYEKVYLEPPTDGVHLYQMLHSFFDEYNNERRHSSIEDDRPKDRYLSFNPPLNQVRAA